MALSVFGEVMSSSMGSDERAGSQSPACTEQAELFKWDPDKVK